MICKQNIFIPQYNLLPSEIGTLTKELLVAHAQNIYDISKNNKFVTIEVSGNSKYSNIGRFIELCVFKEAAGASNAEMIEQYSLYESKSKFFLSIDCIEKYAVGVLRVIENSPKGLKTLNDIAYKPFNIKIDDVKNNYNIKDFYKVWDIGTAAVIPEYRGVDTGLVSVNLYRALYLSSLKNEIEHWVSIIDNKLFKILTGYFAIPFMQLIGSEPGPYLGSKKSFASYAHVPEISETMTNRLRTVNSVVRRDIIERLVNGYDDNEIILEYRGGKF